MNCAVRLLVDFFAGLEHDRMACLHDSLGERILKRHEVHVDDLIALDRELEAHRFSRVGSQRHKEHLCVHDAANFIADRLAQRANRELRG